MSEFRFGYQAECNTDVLPDCPINESGESNKTAYTRTEGEYEALERQLAEAREENKKQRRDFLKEQRKYALQLRQLEEARTLIEDAINEINTDPLEGRKFTVVELYSRLEKLKEQG